VTVVLESRVIFDYSAIDYQFDWRYDMVRYDYLLINRFTHQKT